MDALPLEQARERSAGLRFFPGFPQLLVDSVPPGDQFVGQITEDEIKRQFLASAFDRAPVRP